MLTYTLHKMDGDLAFYHYFPCGNGAAGVVAINKVTGDVDVVTPSKDDTGNRYASKLAKRLREFFANNAYKEAGVISWY